MAVITISRQFGAGGLTLGKNIAEMLGYNLIDEQVLQMVAKKARVSQNWVKSVEKEAGGKLQKFITKLVPKGLVDQILDNERGYIDEEIYLDLLDHIICKIADEDNCIILGRGGQFILKDRKDTLHVLLIADKEYRYNFMETRYKLKRAQAIQVVNAQDKRRINLYRKFGRSDYDHPEHYHISLNMRQVSQDLAAKLICQMVEAI